MYVFKICHKQNKSISQISFVFAYIHSLFDMFLRKYFKQIEWISDGTLYKDVFKTCIPVQVLKTSLTLYVVVLSQRFQKNMKRKTLTQYYNICIHLPNCCRHKQNQSTSFKLNQFLADFFSIWPAPDSCCGGDTVTDPRPELPPDLLR